MDNLLNATNPAVSMLVFMTLLSFLPAVFIMFTSFTRIVVMLSFVKHAIGQQVPPNTVIVGLAIFLSFYIMAPTIDVISKDALDPYLAKQITIGEAIKRAEPPLKSFMLKQTREKDLALFVSMAKVELPATPMDLPIRVIVPSFVISELRTSFEIGFLIFIPFLIIDMVIASILLSMGMMMLPPVMVSLPFKVLLFVLVDGWSLVAGTIVRSFQ